MASTGSPPCRRRCASPTRPSATATRLSIFGWIAAGHQLGAASAAFFAGYMRTVQGNYIDAFIIAGSTGVVAAILALMIRGAKGRTPVPAVA